METYHRYKFVPEKHKQELIGIINDLNALEEYNEKKLGQVLKKYPKNGNQMWEAYQKYSSDAGVKYDDDLVMASLVKTYEIAHERIERFLVGLNWS